ncbi:unnamed protein product [Diplocarpon coronariae]|uniref:Uncharacterized protein n=1 Tax=Diplocarpon coronariae TaxID=2795749 RepID=A0A218ZA56_9HELO|nr:hypothetical protein B2J93_6985 [Marssonina coronariae]
MPVELPQQRPGLRGVQGENIPDSTQVGLLVEIVGHSRLRGIVVSEASSSARASAVSDAIILRWPTSFLGGQGESESHGSPGIALLRELGDHLLVLYSTTTPIGDAERFSHAAPSEDCCGPANSSTCTWPNPNLGVRNARPRWHGG